MTQQAWDREYRARGRLWGGLRLDPHTSRVLDEHPRLSTARWMEAGCGDGKGLVPLLHAMDPGAPRVVALDTSPAALRLARARLAAVHGADAVRRVVFVRGDVRRPPLRPGGFQGIRAVHVVGHLRAVDRAAAMRALLHLLAPEGLLVVSEFGAGDFRAGKGETVEPGTRRRGTGIETHYFTREGLLRLVERSGGRAVRLDEERFHVDYAGARLARQRWDLLATRA